MFDNEDEETGPVLALVIGLALAVCLFVIGIATFAYNYTSGNSTEAAKPTTTPAAVSASVTAPAVTASKAQLGQIGMALAAGKLTLSGNVANDAAKASLLKPATVLYGKDNVVDNLTVKTDAPAFNWASAPLDILARLKNLAGFKLDLNGNSAKLEGEIGSDAAKTEFDASFAKMWGEGVDYSSKWNVNAKLADAPKVSTSVLNEAIEFATSSAAISATSKARLDQIADLLKDDKQKLRVIGHTDSRGQPTTNQALSLARAESVVKYLAEKGVPAANLVASGAGQNAPIADNTTPQGRKHNRRIEFAR